MISSTYRVSIDVGGTFTDAVVVDATGRRLLGKSLTTTERAFIGIASALRNAIEPLELDLESLLGSTDTLIYGTTRATNAIVTRSVARTAFLTTKGFPDILVMKEGGKPRAHDFSVEFAAPYIARRDTREIGGRIGASGEEVEPFDVEEARATVRGLAVAGYEAVAVCLLWSMLEPAHELALAELLEAEMLGVPYTLSHALNPVLREYRRASSAAIDASLKPMMQAHLRSLEADFRDAGFETEVLVSTSMGGCMRLSEVVQSPIHMAKSGPSMAPVASRAFARLEYGSENSLVCDTGGTTFDVGLVRGGELSYTQESWVGGRWVGDILGISSIDIRSLGAGGGSIVWIDEGGMARVGPQSAGAMPGPACYGRGGLEPTVSDAACTLGYLDPDNFLGGRMKLDAEAARTAMSTVAARIGKSVEQTAYDVLRLASELMIEAIQDVTVSEGYDPNEGVLVAGGGAAGINIMMIARELGTRELVLPKEASVLSAIGMQFSDIVREEATSFFTTSANFDAAGVAAAFAALRLKLDDFAQSLPTSIERTYQYYVQARYANQVWELEVLLPTTNHEADASVVAVGATDDASGSDTDAARTASAGVDAEAMLEAFHAAHERVFGLRDPGSSVEFVTWKLRLGARIGIVAGEAERNAPAQSSAVADARRDCWFGGDTAVSTPIHRGASLSPGARLEGPCIVEEPTTTLVIFPGMSATVSSNGNYLMDTDA